MTTHAQLMDDYYSARNAQEWRAEQYAIGYDAETREFYSVIETRITFKSWLVQGSSAHV